MGKIVMYTQHTDFYYFTQAVSVPVKLPELVDSILSKGHKACCLALCSELIVYAVTGLQLANEGHVNSIWKRSLLCVGNRAKCLTRPETTNKIEDLD